MKIYIGPYTDDDKERKIRIRIDKYDTWSMDHTLAMIILPMLKQLKEKKHGIPGSFIYDSEPWIQTEEKKKEFEESIQLWNDTLDKMIWSFQEIVNDDYFEKVVDYIAYEKKIQLGLKLFGENFRNFWD
jgi:hypothetical protein